MENHGKGGRGGRRVRRPGSESGQSTLEFLLVAMAFAAVFCALGALWRAARDGRLLTLASQATSHSTAAGLVVALKDVMGY